MPPGSTERRDLMGGLSRKLAHRGRTMRERKHSRDEQEDSVVFDLGISGMKKMPLRTCSHRAAPIHVHNTIHILL